MTQPHKHKADRGKETAPTARRQGPVNQGPEALLEGPELLALQRALAEPSLATPEGIVALQKTAGNRAVQRLLVRRHHDKDREYHQHTQNKALTNRPSTIPGMKRNTLTLATVIQTARISRRKLGALEQEFPTVEKGSKEIGKIRSTTKGLWHHHIWFDDKEERPNFPTNVGFHTSGKNLLNGPPELFSEDDREHEYTHDFTGRDDGLMRLAIQWAGKPAKNYNLLGYNCQAWVKQVREKYEELWKKYTFSEESKKFYSKQIRDDVHPKHYPWPYVRPHPRTPPPGQVPGVEVIWGEEEAISGEGRERAESFI